ncbi:uncharacterized protein B0H64DRAFT_459470 [Chaetomium fimeti]|uniref:Uncharacterized protein n=1 Tax=Chaetomium fimeti TaxID=1854472 RepID=A0AAE0LSM0_9PEZI|nr:hypothetical protein B0H64DRAFT_459470 [Chaetomium fimeti]
MEVKAKRKAISHRTRALLCFTGRLRTTSKVEVANHDYHTTEPSRLESLPAELRTLLLSSLASLNDLKAATHASPVLYHQYRADRKQILGRVLRCTLGEKVFVDAYAVQKSTRLEYPPYLAAHLTAQAFMDTYQEHRAQPSIIAGECAAADVMGMATFYWSTVGPLMQKIPQKLLHNLDPSLQLGHLSRVEEERILRALYRFEMWCNLYGTKPGAAAGSQSVQPIEMLMYFFQVFEPWEIEEISCIHALLMDMYDHIFVDLKLPLHHLPNRLIDVWSPRAWVTTDLSDSPYAIDQFRHRNAQLNSLISRGLEFQLQTMRTLEPPPPTNHRHHRHHHRHHRHHRKQLRKHIIHPGPTAAAARPPGANSIQDALCRETQTMRRALHRTEGDRAQERGERARPQFRGRDGAAEPALGWVLRWRGRRGNAYGQETPWDLRVWGAAIEWTASSLLISPPESEGMEALMSRRRHRQERAYLLWHGRSTWVIIREDVEIASNCFVRTRYRGILSPELFLAVPRHLKSYVAMYYRPTIDKSLAL